MAPNAARPPLTRHSIVVAARELIRTGGLESLSLRRLAATLGVTAAALYAHVEDKDDLLRAVAEGEFVTLVAASDDMSARTARDRIATQARAYVDHARREPELFRVMFLFPPGPFASTAGGPAALPAATEAYAMASAAVADAISEGSIDAPDSIEATLVFWGATHGIASILQLGLGLDREVEDRLIDELLGRLFAGYAPRPDAP